MLDMRFEEPITLTNPKVQWIKKFESLNENLKKKKIKNLWVNMSKVKITATHPLNLVMKILLRGTNVQFHEI